MAVDPFILEAVGRYANAYNVSNYEACGAAFVNNDTKDRNVAILRDRLDGTTIRELAEKYKISKDRIHHIALGGAAKLRRLSRIKDTKFNDEVILADAFQVFLSEISVRSGNCLRNIGIETMEKLLQMAPEDLVGPNLGERSKLEIIAALSRRRLSLRAKGGDPNGQEETQ